MIVARCETLEDVARVAAALPDARVELVGPEREKADRWQVDHGLVYRTMLPMEPIDRARGESRS